MEDLISGAAFLQMESVRLNLCGLLQEKIHKDPKIALWFYLNPEAHGEDHLVEEAGEALRSSFAHLIESKSDELQNFTEEDVFYSLRRAKSV